MITNELQRRKYFVCGLLIIFSLAIFPLLRYHADMSNQPNLKGMAQVETRRKFLGMRLYDLCARIGKTPQVYRIWRKKGTTALNVRKLTDALHQFAKENKL
jgi:hypothetical protein